MAYACINQISIIFAEKPSISSFPAVSMNYTQAEGANLVSQNNLKRYNLNISNCMY